MYATLKENFTWIMLNRNGIHNHTPPKEDKLAAEEA